MNDLPSFLQSHTQEKWTMFVLLVLTLGGILALTLYPYEWNATALFHIDKTLEEQYAFPEGTVLMDASPSDNTYSALVARNIPALFQPSLWQEVREASPGSESYQRIVFPLVAFILAGGQDSALPYTFLLIQLLSVVITSILFFRFAKGRFYPLSLGLCPAALIALHFTLPDALAILLVTIFFVRFVRKETLNRLDSVLLSLLILTDEMTILFLGLLLIYVLLKKGKEQAKFLIAPFVVFAVWQIVLFLIFEELPLLLKFSPFELPLLALRDIVVDIGTLNPARLSGLAFLGFTVVATLWTIAFLARIRFFSFLPSMTLGLLLLILLMPGSMWSSITSIGRSVLPVYPVFLLLASERDSWFSRMLSLSIMMMGLATSIGLAFMQHLYTLSTVQIPV